MLRIRDLFTLEILRKGIKDWTKVFADIGLSLREVLPGEYRGNCTFCRKNDGFTFTMLNCEFYCVGCDVKGDLFTFISIKDGVIYDGDTSLLLFAQRHRIKPNLPFGKYINSNFEQFLVTDLIVNRETGEWNVLYLPLDGLLYLQFVTLSYFLAPVEWDINTHNRFVLLQEVGREPDIK